MNRKISFRGYNLKNKKWLYGYYLVNRGKHFIAEEGLQPPGMTWEDFEVDPESVGQYVITIGSTDIYEGDIVFALGGCDGQTRQGIVRYDIEGSGFWINISEDESYVPLSAKPVTFQTGETELFFYEVIGNEYEEKLKISNP